jgi:hypothetical protein
MHSVPDLRTRWPVLEVAAKRAHLRNSLHVSPGPLLDTMNTLGAVAMKHSRVLFSDEDGRVL